MDFWTTVFLSASIASIAAMGLFLQIRSGQLNPGMAPFVGVGGYVSGSLCVNLGLSPWLSIPLATIAGFCFGGAFAIITLRLHHWFFAVTTLTLSVAAVSIVGMIDFFGGPVGLLNIPLVTSPVPIIVLSCVVFAIAYLLDRSHIGLQIRAMGDDEVLSQAFGVHVRTLRVFVFALGSAMAAISGALNAHRFGIYEPSDLGFQYSLLLFIYVIVGGKRSIFGPIVGTFFLFAMPEIIKISPETELIVFGALMLAVAIWMPEGLVGAIGSSYRALRKRLA
ncbi:MAG: branched-chain amino acid ABC transporter permease [Rhizobiaceae bacterium]|nr:branched-chain amino acid ABC transporter permease [Rhizobiaceae bacterium]